MTNAAVVIDGGFFFEPVARGASALSLARKIVERAKGLPQGIDLLIFDQPLPVRLAEISPERLAERLSAGKMPLALGIVEFIALLSHEVRPDRYYLETILEELISIPAAMSMAHYLLIAIDSLRKRKVPITGLPPTSGDVQGEFQKISGELGIASDYLLGNLEKMFRLVKLLGVREKQVNLSFLFHNYRSGYFRLQGGGAPPSATLIDRAKGLEEKGTLSQIFKGGAASAKVSSLPPEGLDDLIAQTERNYNTKKGSFRVFIDAYLTVEEARLASSPEVPLKTLLACFKFPAGEREVVSGAGAAREEEHRWKETEIGRALVVLRPEMNWLAASTGMKTAGDWNLLRQDAKLLARASEIRDQAGGFSITISSGRVKEAKGPGEYRISDLSAEEILFDLYTLAVLEKRPIQEVCDRAVGILQFIRKLENREPMVGLSKMIVARLAGEPYLTLLGTQGLVLRNAPLVAALEKLKSLSAKARWTIRAEDGSPVSIDGLNIADLRKCFILMGRRFRVPHSPERVLGVLHDRVIPEILKLPRQVISEGTHDLNRVVELALEGIPPRYPLRRPWKRIDLDRLISLGSCLEPGIRNCLGCPVNNLYALVMKTAAGLGFDEVITYEATGCFEVYSGIWPYTGKKNPSLHGVFGGVPSEMLGGLAAKEARRKFAHKNKLPFDKRQVLHLGWGGDGATFDIGFGNLSGLYSRLQRLGQTPDPELLQRALYVCYDNEGYQNTGNQYSAATAPGGNTTTNPRGKERPVGNEIRKKPLVEIVADHGVPLSARMNIHRQEHISRVIARALEDGDRGSFLHFLQPCTTGWKFVSDDLTFDLSSMSEEGGLFSPVTIEHGVPYLEIYPIPRNPTEAFMKLQARFKHLLGADAAAKGGVEGVLAYYREEWLRNLRLTGFEGEIPQADRLDYLEPEHRFPRHAIP